MCRLACRLFPVKTTKARQAREDVPYLPVHPARASDRKTCVRKGRDISAFAHCVVTTGVADLVASLGHVGSSSSILGLTEQTPTPTIADELKHGPYIVPVMFEDCFPTCVGPRSQPP